MLEKREKSVNGIKTRILILGASLMQGPALRLAREMGLQTVAVDADPAADCVSLADSFEKVDLKDKEGLEALARSLSERGGLGGVMTAGTDFSASVAWVAGKLGLPGIPYEAALDASDKGRMRKRFKEAGLPSPEFIVMDRPPEGSFELPFPWPVVVKPVDNMGSRGCRRVDNFDELKAAVGEALGFSRSGRAIVEEYIEGPEFSVDALVYEGEITICGIADRHIFFPPYFIEMGHTMPSSQDEGVINSLLETFCRGVKALGITNGAAKGDIKLGPRGPMIGEIAGRLSGGFMSGWTYPYSSGVLPTRGALEIALGRKPSGLEPRWDWVCAERAFISIPGKVCLIEGIEKAKAMPWVKDVFLLSGPGTSVKFPENNVTKCGNVLSAAPRREDAVSSAEAAARSILIRLEAPNRETDAFLTRRGEVPGTIFPPDAFAGDPRTEAGLLDYMGRSLEESLEAVRLLTGRAIESRSADSSFWQALIRGGYQGAVYYLDSLGNR
ncbi:MAG: ATP-grasp domain-containing protein [Treponema sp.]|nr:ATP-grasp domain-containing protein [Treponema sp.]